MGRAPRLSFTSCLLLLAFVAGSTVGACSGGEFAEDGAGGGAGRDAGSGASAGSGAGPGGGDVRCHGPDECDDGEPCSVDECDGEGFCQHSPKCASDERCCDGVCSQCCASEDCADDVDCTTDTCFNGFCAHVPDDGDCSAQQYCSLLEGCRDREPCPDGTAAECDDDQPCTTDGCQNGFCDHEFCSVGQQCCPDLGCASCCSDSQCQDTDACTANTCGNGECSSAPLCPGGQCCPSGDGNATCGSCCSVDECLDQVDCTIDSCTVEGCLNIPDSTVCNNGEICDPDAGCTPTMRECQGDAECVSADPCLTGRCEDGTCVFDGCGAGLNCCPGVGCRACCGNPETACAGGQLCCGGVCQECCTLYDCPGGTKFTAATIAPVLCERVTCEQGVCGSVQEDCGDFQICCAPYGCMLGGCADPI